MTEIEELKAQIKVLEKKLSFLEELEKTKSPMEEAYNEWYGEYPPTSPDADKRDIARWHGFQAGYNAAYREPQDNEWKNVALEFGKKLPVILPYSYAELSPNSWYRWVVFTYDKYMEERDKECGYTPNQKAQERGERVHNEMEEVVRESVEWCEEHQDTDPLEWLTPKTPEETAESLREAFVKAQQTEKWKEIQKKIDDGDFDDFIERTNLLDFLKDKLGYSLDCCYEIVDAISEWLPETQSAEGSQNAYVESAVEGWNDAINAIRGKLQ